MRVTTIVHKIFYQTRDGFVYIITYILPEYDEFVQVYTDVFRESEEHYDT